MPPHSSIDLQNHPGHGSSQSYTGFTSSLKTSIMSSKVKIEDWVALEKAKADAAAEIYQQRLLEEQTSIDSQVADLLAIQLELGLNVKDTNVHGKENNSKSIAKRSHSLEEERASLKTELVKLENELETRGKRVKDIELEEEKQRARAAEARALKERVREAKQTTVDDLTRGIVNYKYLGLDFEKSEGENELRFSFTQLDANDPTKQFSFVLQVDDEDRYEVANCIPSIDAATLTEITDVLNSTDDMSHLVRQMRRAFVETL